MHRKAWGLAGVGFAWATLALAQAYDPVTAIPPPNQNYIEKGPWQEQPTALPSGLRTQGLIPIDMRNTELRFGIDPDSVTVGQDDVVRYVLVATSASGAVNAMQEGVRCIQGEAKVFARYTSGSGWSPVASATWQPLASSARYTQAVVSAGLCANAAQARRSADEVRRALISRAPPLR